MKLFSQRNVRKLGLLALFIAMLGSGANTMGMEALAEGFGDAVSEGATGLGEGASTAIGDATRELITTAGVDLSGDALRALKGASGDLEKVLTGGVDAALKGVSAVADVGETEISDLTEALGKVGEEGEAAIEKVNPEEAASFGSRFKEALVSFKNQLRDMFTSLKDSASNLVGIGEKEAGEDAGIADQVGADAAAKDTVDAAGGKAGENASKAAEQQGWIGSVGGYAVTALSTLAAGFIFMFPNWIMEAIQSNLTHKADLGTIEAPQNFGGVWMRIPDELIDEGNPQATIPLYSRIINPDPKRFYNWSRTGGVGFKGDVDNYTFFVSSGAYDDCDANFSWATSAIPYSGFRNQMINISSGLEALGNGYPANAQYPFRQPFGQTDTYGQLGYGCRGTTYSMARYLQVLDSALAAGKPFQEKYDMYSGTRMITASGGAGQPGLAKQTPEFGSKYIYKSPTDNLLTRAYKDIGDTQAMTLADRMNQPFTLGKAVTRNAKGEKISGGFTLQSMQALNADANAKLNAGLSISDAYNASFPPPGNGIMVYQTTDTPLATMAIRALKAGAQADIAPHVVDYVAALADDGATFIPAQIPTIVSGAKDTEPARVVWSANPEVRYIASFASNTKYDVTDGSPSPVDLSKFPGLNPDIQKQITGMTSVLTSATESGPFVYGGFTLTYPDQLSAAQQQQLFGGKDQSVFIFAIDPKNNNGRTTLETNATDYVVPLAETLGAVPLQSPNLKYFASLVTSTLYTTNLTPVADVVDFGIFASGNAVAVAPNALIPDFKAKGWDFACKQCADLSTQLGTLYQEYDLNPYNSEKLGALLELPQALTAALQADSYFADVPSQFKDRLAFVATKVQAALMNAGLTPDMLKGLKEADVQKIAEAIAAVLVDGIKNTLSDSAVTNKLGLSQATVSAIFSAAGPQDIIKLINADNPQMAKAFTGLGAKLKGVLPAAAAPVFDAAVKQLGQDTGVSFQQELAKAVLIPVGALYIYSGLGLAPDKKTIAATLADNALNKIIISTHAGWKLWKLAHSKDTWLKFAELGPFQFTTAQLPNIVLQATSLTDIEAGDFVYQSDTYPGDYFIVATSIGSPTAPSVPTQTEPFDATNPQPYLISLISGTIYERGSNGQVDQYIAPDGSSLPLSNLEAVKSALKSADLRKALGSVSVSRETSDGSGWQTSSFANFLLTVDPQEAQKGAYIYEDITNSAKVPPALDTITNFFVGVKQKPKASCNPPGSECFTIGVPISDATDIVSLVTGKFYGKNPSSTFDTGQLLANPNVQKAGGDIMARVRKLAEDYQKALSMQIPPIPPEAQVKDTLYPADVSAILDESLAFVSPAGGPYEHLKEYKSKYYGVTSKNDPYGSPISTIFDYNTTMNINGKSAVVGVLYDSSGNPLTDFADDLLDIARRKVGIAVVGDNEVLGVPNANPDFAGVKANSKPFTKAMKATDNAGDAFEMLQYIEPVTKSLSVVALVTPKSGGAYYTNMFAGDQYMTDGSARIGEYQLFEDGKKHMIAHGGSDQKLNTPIIFGAGADGYYYAFDYTQDFKSKKDGKLYSGFKSIGSQGKKAGEQGIAVSPTALPASSSWSVVTGDVNASGAMTNQNPPVVFKPVAGQLVRRYHYLGTSKTALTGSTPQYEGGDITYEADAVESLFMVGSGSQAAFKPKSIFMAPPGSQIDGQSVPAGALIEATTKDGKTFSASTLPDGSSIFYTIKLFDNLTDTRTGGKYIAIVGDDNLMHFYAPVYASTSPASLKQVQDKLKAYVSMTAYGDIGLFEPLSSTTLRNVDGILGVPKDKANDMQTARDNFGWLPANGDSQFLYNYSAAFASDKPYYRDSAGFVDIRSGVLYDNNGIPMGSALSYAELQLLMLDNNVSVPATKSQVFDSSSKKWTTVDFDPSKYKTPDGMVNVPQGFTPGAKSAVLFYRVS